MSAPRHLQRVTRRLDQRRTVERGVGVGNVPELGGVASLGLGEEIEPVARLHHLRIAGRRRQPTQLQRRDRFTGRADGLDGCDLVVAGVRQKHRSLYNGIRSTICSAVLARLAIACASFAIVEYSSAPFASTSSEQSSTAITLSVMSTSARSGFRIESYSSSEMVIESMVTGSTRVNPQMNRIRGYFSRGMGCAGASSPPPPSASPIASIAAPIRPASFELGRTIFSSAASCGPMPNSFASTLSSSSMLAALKCALNVIFSNVD